MSITKSFNGNVVDEAGNAIDCRVKGLHVEQGVWSDWKDTTSQYYSRDLGDGDWLTQDGHTGQTDDIVLVFETMEAEPKDRKFAVYEFTMDGSDTYDVDVQLKACMDPLVAGLWELSSPTDGNATFVNADDGDKETYVGRINEAINAVQNVTDNKSWVYGGMTLWHKAEVHGTDVFGDRLGVASVEYDWTEDDGFVTDASHTFTVISQVDGDKAQEVEIKVVNEKGLEVRDVVKLQVRYNSAVADLGFSPVEPSVADTFTVTGACGDVDSRVTAISWKYDGTEVANNTTLDYEWVQDLGSEYVDAGHTLNADVTWNAGFNNHTIVHQEHFDMTKLAPTFTLTDEVIGDEEDNTMKFTLSDLVDPDGDDSKLEAKWVIKYKTPIDNQWVVVLDNGYPGAVDLDPKQWTFEVAGEYIIAATVKDEWGAEATQELVKTFESGSKCEGSGRIRLNTSNGKARWQQIAIPVKNKNVKNYFIDWIDAKIKEYDANKSVRDVIERVSAYPGNLDTTLTYIPGSTPDTAVGNFSLVMEDGTNVNEIVGFWAKIKDYKGITGGEEILYEWNMGDA